jgi:hypothetical protein
MMSPVSTSSSIYLQIDNTSCNLSLGGATIPANTLTWINYQNGSTTNHLTVNLTGGQHQFILAGASAGISIDKILLLTNVSCTPTGDGSNCQPGGPSASPGPSPSPVVIPPTPPQQLPVVSGKIDITPPQYLTDTTYSVDGKTQASEEVNTDDLSNGLHTISVSGIDANGNEVTYTETIRVKNRLSLAARLASDKVQLGVAATIIIAVICGWIWRRQLLRLLPHQATAMESPAGPSSDVPPVQVVLPDGFQESTDTKEVE